ncbi:MAG TPA: hypothetical protein D7I02_00730 [Candidatus Poseidoniales archaeon]|nr:MAG TPA: hypothetical protein D7I02_00730 [Candidatus Poseidoniales archaeon]DAC64725.1 MAG TPA: hypothetical protein D7I04_01050 [Candidatus Poseidoniales archaeon]DAC65168.1 MAG TPA: hypothetical protein D7I14_07070 [Candidatus Poseidoniales archaeon]
MQRYTQFSIRFLPLNHVNSPHDVSSRPFTRPR